MYKLLWILISGIIIVTGAYFLFFKNDNTLVPSIINNSERQDVEPTISQQQTTQVKTSPQTITPKATKPSSSSNIEGIPQPPKLPE